MGQAKYSQTTQTRTRIQSKYQMKNIPVSDTTMSMLLEIGKRHGNKKISPIIEDLIEEIYLKMKRTGGKVL